MTRSEDLPSLEESLKQGFSELKVGEGKFELEKEPDNSIEMLLKSAKESLKLAEGNKINYGQKFSSKGNESSFIVKPIKSNNAEEKSIRETKRSDILTKPSSNIGDDIEVDW